MAYLTKSGPIASIAGWTLMGWAVGITRHWLVLAAFVPDATWLESTLLTIMLTLVIAVPSSPGFVGVFQLVGQQALVLPFAAKYDPETALSIVIVLHLTLLVVSTTIGAMGTSIISQKLRGQNLISRFFDRASEFKNLH